jgi:hypothetical protein
LEVQICSRTPSLDRPWWLGREVVWRCCCCSSIPAGRGGGRDSLTAAMPSFVLLRSGAISGAVGFFLFDLIWLHGGGRDSGCARCFWFVFRDLLSGGLRRCVPSPRLDQKGVGHPLPLLRLLLWLLYRRLAPSGLVARRWCGGRSAKTPSDAWWRA